MSRPSAYNMVMTMLDSSLPEFNTRAALAEKCGRAVSTVGSWIHEIRQPRPEYYDNLYAVWLDFRKATQKSEPDEEETDSDSATAELEDQEPSSGPISDLLASHLHIKVPCPICQGTGNWGRSQRCNTCFGRKELHVDNFTARLNHAMTKQASSDPYPESTYKEILSRLAEVQQVLLDKYKRLGLEPPAELL